MKPLLCTLCLSLLLSACAAASSSSGGSELYGEIKAGVETSHTR